MIITTIEELLILSSKGRSKEQISYEVNLNTALLQKYLRLLLELGLLENSKNPRDTYHKITPRGSAFLNDLKCLERTSTTSKVVSILRIDRNL